MAETLEAEISQKIVDLLANNGGRMTFMNMQHFCREVGVTCSMSVFRRVVRHLTRPRGDVVQVKSSRKDPHVLEDDGITFILAR
jgi:ribosomal protein S25